MRIIEPDTYLLRRKSKNVLQCIEQAARLAYKSEDKITPDSAKPFCKKLLDRKHYPVFEFANLHFKFCGYTEPEYIRVDEYVKAVDIFAFILRSFPFLHVTEKFEVVQGVGLQKVVYVSGTVRVFEEAIGNPLDVDAKYSDNLIWAGFVNFVQEYFVQQGLPEGIPRKLVYFNPWKEKVEFKALRVGEILVNLDENERNKHCMVGVRVVCSRAVSHELVRHRRCSFIQESQRYCNYSNNKFNKEITFISPSAFYPAGSPEHNAWKKSMEAAEDMYMRLLKMGCTPQSARNVLPNSCATELIMYATVKEWLHIFSLRTVPAADPAMQQIMKPLNKRLVFALDCFE